MSQKKSTKYRGIVKKATTKQKKALADHVIEIRHIYNVELYSMPFRKRLSAAWDIIIKGKGK